VSDTADAGLHGLPISRRVMNLANFVTQMARRLPDAIGMAAGDDAWTWREIDGRVSALASALAARGVRKGDRVLAHSKNCREMVEAMFATFRLGAVWVPTNWRITPRDLAATATHCDVKALLWHEDFPAHAAAVRAAVPGLAVAATLGHVAGEPSVAELMAGHRGEQFRNADVNHDDPCWFFQTSGTTGRSKSAVLTHGQMAFVLNNHLCDLMPGTTERDVSLVVAPLSHGAGLHLLTQVARGAKTVLMQGDKFEARQAWRLVEQHRVTNLFTVPTIVKVLVEDPAVDEFDRSSLRYLIYAGAPMYRADQKAALRKLGKVIVQYFGLGEFTGNITVLPAELHEADDDAPGARIGTCGFERTGVQVSIQDETGREVPDGETGEICVCGPAMFAGYWLDAQANEQAFRDGWFRTSDLGRIDAQGFLYITGRASDMYISGGSNIYPKELEEKILMHPAVGEACVLGWPDPFWGEVGVAVCVAKAGQRIDEQELLAWLGAQVASYKVPKRVIVWDEMPKSAYGKITKKLVRDALEQRGGPGR
jgi:fatty-acyl-CoA synthase